MNLAETAFWSGHEMALTFVADKVRKKLAENIG